MDPHYPQPPVPPGYPPPGYPPQYPQSGHPPPDGRPPRRSWPIFLLVGLVALGVGGAIGWFIGQTVGDDETDTIASAPAPVAPAAPEPTTDEPAATTAPPPAVALEDIAPCRLPNLTNARVAAGFPRSPDSLPTTGRVTVAVLFADFADVSAAQAPEDVFAIISPAAEEFFQTVSYGQLDLRLEPHLRWLRLAGTSSDYAAAIGSFEGHRDFIAEAVNLADADVDFTGADAVLVVSTPEATQIEIGPTWTGGDFPGGSLTPDGQVIYNGITSGADLIGWQGLWLPHEMGHSMSLPDLYSFENLPGFTGPFSLMNDIGGRAPELLAFERWQLGWLDDAQIACIDGDSTVELTAVETEGGLKAAMVPTGEGRAVVVESRRAIGYDSGLAAPGALVYLVDTSLASGFGPIEVLNDKQTLLAGDSVSADGITISVTEAPGEGDTVEIRFAE